jgi:S-adenosylhomocysteine hydrolase
MPVLAAVAAELARTRPLAGQRIAACLHVTTHTRRRDLLAGIAGATEVTSTGVLRAHNMAREAHSSTPSTTPPPSTCARVVVCEVDPLEALEAVAEAPSPTPCRAESG